MNRIAIYTLSTLSLVFLFLCLTNASINNKHSLPSYSKSISSFHQSPKSADAITDFSIQFEEDDDDTKNKFKFDLLLINKTQYFKLNTNNYTLNYFSSTISYTNLYNGIPIYSAIGNYRI